MSVSEIKERQSTITYQGKRPSRQSVEYYAPNLNSNIHRVLKAALSEGYVPAKTCVAEVSDYEYLSFSYENRSVQLNINGAKPETVDLSDSQNVNCVEIIEGEISTLINSVFKDLSSKPQLSQIPNLWFDLFCIYKVVLSLLEKDEMWLNLILMFGKDAPMNTVYFSRIYPITLPETVTSSIGSISYVDYEVKDRNDETKMVKRTKLVIKDPVQKDLQISINARYSAPRINDENPRFEFLSMLESALNMNSVDEEDKTEEAPRVEPQRPMAQKTVKRIASGFKPLR